MPLVAVSLDFSFLVEEDHVVCRQRASKFERLFQSYVLMSFHLLLCDCDDEMHRNLRVALLEVFNLASTRSVGRQHGLQHSLLVVLCPLLDRELGDLQRGRASLLNHAHGLIANLVRRQDDTSLEASIPGAHVLHWLASKVPLQVRNDVPWMEVRKEGGPASSNSFGAVHKDKRERRNVPLRLDPLTLLDLEVQQGVVRGMEDQASDLLEASVNVTGTGGILTALNAGSELTRRHQQVHVVRSDECLC
mmetsp:Transcript_55488/g.130249  ORF Transcript_55488/g.130249 Transcript_55488/m.130249 type:complete len:248 (+) Transcript_55488:1115-1858(+)